MGIRSHLKALTQTSPSSNSSTPTWRLFAPFPTPRLEHLGQVVLRLELGVRGGAHLGFVQYPGRWREHRICPTLEAIDL